MWVTETNNSFGKKPVASTVVAMLRVAMLFEEFVGMSSGLANMTKFKKYLRS